MVKDTGSLNHFAALSFYMPYQYCIICKLVLRVTREIYRNIVLQRKRRVYDMVMSHLGSVATGIFSDHRIRFMLHSQNPPDSYGRSPIVRVSPWRAKCAKSTIGVTCDILDKQMMLYPT